MTTYCRSCNKDITKYEKKQSKFVTCKFCNRSYPKGNNIMKGGKKRKMTKKLSEEQKKLNKEKRKKEGPVKSDTKKEKAIQMLKAGKSNEEILEKVGLNKFYLRTLKWKFNKGEFGK